MKKSDLFFPLLSVLFGGSYWIVSSNYPGQSAFFPRAVIVVLFIFSIIYVVKEFLKRRGEEAAAVEDSRKSVQDVMLSIGFRRALILCSAIFLYWLLAKPLGFILTNLIILLGLMKFLGAKWSRAIILTLLMTLILHFFFREYLHVPFPRGPGEWFYFWLKRSFF